MHDYDRRPCAEAVLRMSAQGTRGESKAGRQDGKASGASVRAGAGSASTEPSPPDQRDLVLDDSGRRIEVGQRVQADPEDGLGTVVEVRNSEMDAGERGEAVPINPSVMVQWDDAKPGMLDEIRSSVAFHGDEFEPPYWECDELRVINSEQPSPPDHNPEQVVERLRELALKIASDIEPDWPHAEELHRDVQAVRHAANLLDYYASVVEGLTEAIEPFAALADEVDRMRHGDYSTCPHRLEAGAIRKARAALQHAQSKAEPGANNA